MILQTFTLTLASTHPIQASASQLRGFFATKFNEYTLLHQHNTNHLIYRYPLVQYKIIESTPTVIGINEGAEVLKEIYNQYDEINLGANVYEVMERGISVRNQEFGLADEMHTYRFATPWFALNQENYKRFYLAGGRTERAGLLNRTLTGNILSMAKSLAYQVPDRIQCETDVNIRKGRQKDINIMTFTGNFRTNFLIPDYLGLGKSVSRGFGAVLEHSRPRSKQ
ncbi:MAG: CRISPR-associated endonuclease Cas6 [Methanosarcinales archaeon]|nr:CRISPR-associated endonuclease Cas6 [Methanosarcinales archaeon]